LTGREAWKRMKSLPGVCLVCIKNFTPPTLIFLGEETDKICDNNKKLLQSHHVGTYSSS
jgi:hypothetical protein